MSKVKQSSSFPTMVNEVRQTTSEYLTICVRYVSSEKYVKTSFLSDTAVLETTAENITNKIVSELNRIAMNWMFRR